MFWNYCKIAYRNLIRQKLYSLINILCLGLGMACCFLVLLWVLDEFSFDDFHENGESIYRVVIHVNAPNDKYDLQWVPTAMGPGLMRDIPEVIGYTRIMPLGHIALDKDNIALYQNAYYVDSSFLKIFTFPIMDGNQDFVFNDPVSIVLTSNVARKFFETDKGVADKTIRIASEHPFKIGAVIENVPLNSSLKFDILLPFAILEKYSGYSSSNWDDRNTITFVQLQKGTDINALNEKLKGYFKSKVNTPNFKDEMFLQPLKEVHLFSKYSNEERLGSIKRAYIIITVAVLILIMACINFTNLSTAQASRRAVEIGVRKVFGASRSGLITQFLGESVFLSFFAFLVGLCITLLLLPEFNLFTGKELELNLLGNWGLLGGMLVITLLTGLAAGAYPAFYLSQITPDKILQGASRTVSKNATIRKILIVLQFAFSVLLIICSFIIYSQLDYMRNKDLGYDLNNVIRISHRWEFHGKTHKAFRDKLTSNPYIISAAGSAQNPTKIYWTQRILQWQGKSPDDNNNIPNVWVTPEFMRTMKMEVQEGEAINPDLTAHQSGVVVLNRQAVKRMGFTDPCSESITIDGKVFKVIGVLKETHLQPMYHDIMPTVIVSNNTVIGGFTLVRLDHEHIIEGIQAIQSIWQEYFPQQPLEYEFLENDFKKIYYLDSQMGKIMNLFALFAVVLSSMGLFSMVSFTTRLRTQEIGIRRVFGASKTDLIFLFTREFSLLVGIANIVAWPFIYYFMKDWLKQFSYRMEISYLIFLIIFFISILIALMTVSSQIWYMTTKKPMQSLRSE